VPFQGNTLPGICAAIVADTPPVPSTLRGEIPVELDGIIMRCLEKDKTRRFASAEGLAAALEPFAEPFVDFGAMVPFSWLPETIGIRDTVTPDSEGFTPTAVAPAVESPRVFPDSHERTLQSGKPLGLPVSRSRRRQGTAKRPLARVLVGLLVAAVAVAVALLLHARFVAPSAAPAEMGSVPKLAVVEREATPKTPPSAKLEPRADVSAVSRADRAEGAPAIPASVRTPVRPRPLGRAPEASAGGADPEIRLTR
jgi:serine/threonine-protein kinase